MAIQVKNTKSPTSKPSVVMVLYGDGGVGKTTMAANAPKPLIFDFENGTKFLGQRGIDADVVHVADWKDVSGKHNPDLPRVIANYDTIVIDPVGEAMNKLLTHIKNSGVSKWVQRDGSLTIAGWGEAKEVMRNFIKYFRDSGKHLLIVGHVEEKDDEGKLVKRPLVPTKLSQELINMVDVVGYFTVVPSEGDEIKRVVITQPGETFYAKDRTDKMERFMQPDFNEFIRRAQEGDWDETPPETPQNNQGEEGSSDTAQTSIPPQTPNTEANKSSQKPNEVELSALNLDGNIVKLLTDGGITSVNNLIQHTIEQVSDIKGIGEASMKKITQAVAKAGLAFEQPVAPEEDLSDEDQSGLNALRDEINNKMSVNSK